jgi:hypothetical protein
VEDGMAYSTGIAGLLEQCPKLKLIVLNGCATKGQLKQLGNLKNPPGGHLYACTRWRSCRYTIFNSFLSELV